MKLFGNQLQTEIKPIVKRFKNRPSAHEIIESRSINSYQYTRTHVGWSTMYAGEHLQYFYGIRMEKHRRKCIGLEKVTDGEGRIKNKYKYQPAFWLVHLYVIPVKVLDTLGLHAVQYGLKTFSIKPAKKI